MESKVYEQKFQICGRVFTTRVFLYENDRKATKPHSITTTDEKTKIKFLETEAYTEEIEDSVIMHRIMAEKFEDKNKPEGEKILEKLGFKKI
jgi:hypothetical protein